MATTSEGIGIAPEETLSERLSRAYKRISPNLRALARRDFCEAHQITDQTFRAKRAGINSATVGECEWLEAYNPHVHA